MTTPESERPTELLAAVNTLSDRVATLSEKVDVAARIATRTRRLNVAVSIIIACVLAFGGYQWHRVSQGAKSVCLSANESRSANLLLWDKVLTSVEANSDPAGKVQLDKLLTWIAVLYQPHDCDDLGHVYKVPPPPSLG